MAIYRGPGGGGDATVDTELNQFISIKQEALTAASNANDSAVAAANSAADAAASVVSAAAVYDSFDDRYLGSKASAPSVDNDGNALLEGALYWNSTDNLMFVYNGLAWVNIAPDVAETLVVNNVQLGDSLTATNNFVLKTNADGTAKLARGNVGATTQDILTVGADGKVTSDLVYTPAGAGAVATTVQAELQAIPKKVGKNKPLYKNKLIVFCGDSTTEQGQVSMRGGLYDRLLNFHSVSGGILEDIKGVVNYGMSAYTLSQFVNDAANPSFVGASASNPDWNYAGVKTWGIWGGIPLADAVKTAGDVYVICYGINDLILSSTGAGTETQCKDYIVNLLSQAVEKLTAALPSAQIVLRPPNPMTSRPYNQTGFPSQAVYPTFGTDVNVDSALVQKWNNALYYAYYQVAQTYKHVDFLDVWNMVAYNWYPGDVPANKNPYAWDLVHPNNAGYTAIADGLAMLLAGKTSGYSQPRATQAEGLVPYYGGTPLNYYGRYPDGPYYNKLFENYGTVTTTYIDIAIPLTSFKSIIGDRTAFTFCLQSNQFKSRAVTFSEANLSDPTGLGVTTRIGGLTIDSAATGSGFIGIYEDKRNIVLLSRNQGSVNITTTGSGSPYSGSTTFTLPVQGTYLVTLNARTQDSNHGRLGAYLITFDTKTYQYTSTQLIGAQITKGIGSNIPLSLTCSVTSAGVVTVSITTSVAFTWVADYSFTNIMKQ